MPSTASGPETERVYSQRKIYISKGGDKKEKSEEKRLSGEAYDTNKRTI